MTMDASLELMRAVMDALRGDATVIGFVGERIYDRVPEKQDGTPDVPFPYISMGPTSSVPADFDCLKGEDVTLQVDVWSSGGGEAWASAQCRKIAGAVKRALHDVDLTLAENALVTLQMDLMRILDDPNPTIHHGVLQFTGTIETP